MPFAVRGVDLILSTLDAIYLELTAREEVGRLVKIGEKFGTVWYVGILDDPQVIESKG